MASNLFKYVITLLEGPSLYLFSVILKKMPKFIIILVEFLNISKILLPFLKYSFYSLINYSFHSLNRILYGIYWMVCLSYSQEDKIIKVVLKSNIN